MHTREQKLEAFGRLLDVMDTLREQCPWDRKQTNESLRQNTIEEVYELTDAIIQDNPAELRKELGDVLLHIVFYAKIGEEKGLYDIADVANSLCDKLIYRHPHIYASTEVHSAEEVASNWEQLKLKEKGGNKTVLGGVPRSLPALIKAYRIQDKARGVGFDWEHKEDVWQKVQEEYHEVQEAIKQGDSSLLEEEFGDLLFAVINAARLYKINPDNALERTNAKFIHRFNRIEEFAKSQQRDVASLSLEEMETIWQQAKEERS
ncbi:nucleoside triphosphate pyrophosphohydrolase [Porphyromonas crevioricanis]|uniref:Nucleoside triphosphate pyrophosphohydrolase n=1 Tax=Porphyromonas crevioricanis TaxID=393921 RepID=A0AB34PF86_9PORP|nr:nucleoside triphosphate pyrophosphohydrolase [Porphyromonas crevioricanis]KGN93706.1 hypothetical protein HQ38_08715 [Porphyromonas crevioricanis]